VEGITSREKPHDTRFYDLTNQQFERLLVVEYAGQKMYGGRNRNIWKCQCSCGQITYVQTQHLTSKRIRSCGCLAKDELSARRKTHGKSKTSIFSIYNNMIKRCLDIKDGGHPSYGGRGIKVCERWLESFENFYEDMGDRPSNEYSIDRVNNNGNYSKENCRWATKTEQNNNTRQNVLIEYNGEIKTASQWSKVTNIPVEKILYRYKKKWDLDKVFDPRNQRW